MRLLHRFGSTVLVWARWRADEKIPAEEFVDGIRKLAAEYADIFAGRTPGWTTIAGWNTQSLAPRARAMLGEYWEREHAKCGDDPLRVLFTWVAESMLGAFNQQDAALTDIDMVGRIRRVRDLLLGLARLR